MAKKKHEEHENHERWLVSYADFITLLLALFVGMYSRSSVNEGKYRVLSDSMVAAFRGAPRTMQPLQAAARPTGPGVDPEVTVLQRAMLEERSASVLQGHPVGGPTDPNTLAFRRMSEEIEMALAHLTDAQLVSIRRHANWIEVEVRTDILFPSGSATLSPGALPVLEQIAATLAPLPNDLRVEGHTDDVPVKSGLYRSNWELSAARAASVVHLFTERGVPAPRMSVVAHGEQRPVQANTTAAGRNANRRVMIVIMGGEQRRVAPGGTETASVTADPAGPDGKPSTPAL